MDTVNDMLQVKGRDVWSIDGTQSVYEAIEMMAKMQVGALIVLDDDSRLTGIISERDYARKVILRNKSSRETQVADIMTRDVICVANGTSIDKCMALMSEKKIRHLPVMDSGSPAGIITIGDLLKFVIKKQTVAIKELESYIMEETGGES